MNPPERIRVAELRSTLHISEPVGREIIGTSNKVLVPAPGGIGDAGAETLMVQRTSERWVD